MSRAAKRAKVSLPVKAAYGWLRRSDTVDWLALGMPSARDSSFSNLLWILGGDRDERLDEANLLVQVAARQVIRAAASPNEAVGISQAQTLAAADVHAAEIKSVVAEQAQVITNRLDAQASFADLRRTLHPWRAEAARSLREQFPVVEQVLSGLSNQQDRRQVLVDWGTHPPEWLGACSHWQVFGLLLDLASDYAADHAADTWSQRMVVLGASPRAYWQARSIQHSAHRRTREELEPLLSSLAEQHPFARLLLCDVQGDLAGVLAALDDWQPEAIPQKAERELLIGNARAAGGQLTPAIAGLERASALYPESSGIMLTAARLILERAARGDSSSRMSEARRALEYSLKARDNRRLWGGDSGVATVTAVQAAMISGNPARARQLTQLPPEGEAIESEATSAAVRQEAALAAALTGDAASARALVEEIPACFKRYEVEAILADRDDDSAGAVHAWRAAWEAAVDNGEKLRAALGLAEQGAVIPDLGDLESNYGYAVDEIKAVSRAMSSSTDLLTALRAHAHESPTLTVKLAELLRQSQDYGGSARTLELGANRWSNARMMLVSAESWYGANALEKARSTANQAALMGGDGWEGASDAHALSCHVSAELGDWDSAAQAATAMLTINPANESARWALVRTNIQRAALVDAWNALSETGEPISPRDAEEASLWIKLFVRFAAEERIIERASTGLGPWLEDEQVYGGAVAALLVGLNQRAIQLSEHDLSLWKDLQTGFFARFPDSSVLKAITFTPGSEVQVLADLVHAAQNPAADELLERVRIGELPVGMAMMAAGRTYAEAALYRVANGTLSVDPGWQQAPQDAPEGRPLVLDTTAARTLAVLPADIRDALLGSLDDLRTTNSLLLDSINALESVTTMSGMTIGWDDEVQKLSSHRMTEGERLLIIEHATVLADVLGRVRAESTPDEGFLSELSDQVWVSGLQLAQRLNGFFWCDDRVLASLARSEGIPSLTTPRLLLRLKESGVIESDLFDVALGVLIQNYHRDLGFSKRSFEHAATMDGWRARGAAAALTVPSTWIDPAGVQAFLLEACRMGTSQPQEIQAWVSAGATGLTALADNSESRDRSLEILLTSLLDDTWVSPSVLPYVLSGIRRADLHGAAPEEILQRVVKSMFLALSEEHSAWLAKDALSLLFAQASADDKAIVARVVLMTY